MFAAFEVFSLGLQDLILKVRKVQFRFVFRFLTTTKELLEIWIYFLLIKSVDEFFFFEENILMFESANYFQYWSEDVIFVPTASYWR